LPLSKIFQLDITFPTVVFFVLHFIIKELYISCFIFQYLHSLMMLQQQNKNSSQTKHGNRLHHVEMALEALRNVIKNHPGKISLKE
jgi:hypothetical protein